VNALEGEDMTAPTFDVIVCGSLHLDIMLYAPALPKLDETVPGRRWEETCGGKGGNQAVMAARAGARTAMIGRVGDDAFGRRLLRNLADAGVDATEVRVDSETASGMSVAIVQDDGDYGAVIVSGANLRSVPETLDGQWSSLGGARVLVLQNEIPEAVNLAAATAARMFGARVVLNAAPARAMSQQLLDSIDMLVVNRIEAQMLAGNVIDRQERAFEAARNLQAGRREVIVTLGSEGLVIISAGADPIWVRAKSVPVVSTHGAGDCFVGTLAARLAAGDSTQKAAEAANAAAAKFVAQQDRIAKGDKQSNDHADGLGT
jgi:ribokinase